MEDNWTMKLNFVLMVILFPLCMGNAQPSNNFRSMVDFIISEPSIPKRLFNDSSCFILLNKEVRKIINEREASIKSDGIFHLDSIINRKYDFYLILYPGAVGELFIVFDKYKIGSKRGRVIFSIASNGFNGFESDYKIFDWALVKTKDKWEIKKRKEKPGPWSYPPIKRMPR